MRREGEWGTSLDKAPPEGQARASPCPLLHHVPDLEPGFAHTIPFNPHNGSYAPLFPIVQIRTGSSERLSELPSITQLVSGEPRFQPSLPASEGCAHPAKSCCPREEHKGTSSGGTKHTKSQGPGDAGKQERARTPGLLLWSQGHLRGEAGRQAGDPIPGCALRLRPPLDTTAPQSSRTIVPVTVPQEQTAHPRGSSLLPPQNGSSSHRRPRGALQMVTRSPKSGSAAAHVARRRPARCMCSPKPTPREDKGKHLFSVTKRPGAGLVPDGERRTDPQLTSPPLTSPPAP